MAYGPFATFLILITTMIPELPAKAQQNPIPFTQDQVEAIVRDGLGNETVQQARTLVLHCVGCWEENMNTSGIRAFLETGALSATGTSAVGKVGGRRANAHQPAGRRS
jgi:hypothetical protein